METAQNYTSKDNTAPLYKPVDFTVRSEQGLGQLKHFPREIRNIIYSSLLPTLLVHGLQTTTIDRCVIRKLVQTPLLATSKQLCVEFLEVFMRKVNLEEDDQNHHGDNQRARCLEELAAFVKPRIDIRCERNNGMGLKLNSQQTKTLLKKLQRLWAIHENFGVPSDKFFINIDYHDPRCWLDVALASRESLPKTIQELPTTFWDYEFENASARVTLSDENASMQAMTDMEARMRDQMSDYKATKLRQFRTLFTVEKDRQVMEETLDWIFVGLEKYPVAGLLKLHSSMSEMAINFWKPREEQYSVCHLFDLAESWLEAKNE